MSVLVPKSACFFFTSDEASGARNVSQDGSKFTVYLDRPISIPKSAMDCTIEVNQATIWNTSYNISSAFNNNVFAYRTGNVNFQFTIVSCHQMLLIFTFKEA